MKENIRIAYIGGGSRLWARNLMSDLALEPDVQGTVALYDIDQEAAERNAKVGTLIMQLPEAVGHWRYEVAPTLEAALQGADFVFISILPATFEEMEQYVHIPEKWGILQPVGDTAGVAGLFRALIVMPIYERFARAIQTYCPDAWVFNFTNPMTMCVRILYHVFPAIKAFGNCHEVFSTQKILARALEEITGLNAKREDIHINPLGINHFTWITSASYRDFDLFPLYRQFAQSHREAGLDEGHYPQGMTVFQSAERVKFDLFLKYGAIAAAGDRHLVEFMPQKPYLENPASVREWKFFLTPVSFRKANMRKGDDSARKIIAGEETAKIVPSGEEGIAQLKALLGLGELITNVNMPNVGQIPDLPLGEVVETNAVFRKDYVHPVFAGPLPDFAHAITAIHARTHAALIESFDHRDLSFAKKALHDDPSVRHLPSEAIDAMFEEIVTAVRPYLSYYFVPALKETVHPQFFSREGRKLPYVLFTPEDFDPRQTYPLVIFLHGVGERGDDGILPFRTTNPAHFLRSEENKKRYPCFILVPQCADKTRWVSTEPHHLNYEYDRALVGTPLIDTIALIDQLTDVYPIDKNRLYLTGLSMGGYGTLYALSRFPDLFAAGVPLCGGVDPAQNARLAHTPIWAFHGDSDTMNSVENSRALAVAMEKYPGIFRYTEMPGFDHNIWDVVYQDDRVYQWLFSQKIDL